ncbi:MAG: COX15/CtaA family protein [Pseudomonadota bacterium]|nr:MAG: COX15/CtaA family protein [Pseudomonadota bacterium]
MNTGIKRVALLATALALVVVVLGAYVRLSDAGLGCPDWPGCYGKVGVPTAAEEVQAANAAYPERPVEAPKAWKEMVHRYFAGTLGLLVFALAVMAWRARRQEPLQPVGVATFLVALIIFQALLGMWTVTLLLKPVVVMSHLLGGLTTLSLLWWMTLRQRDPLIATSATPEAAGLRPLALLGLVILVLQLALGGWVSANYAALQCPDFPTCQGQWWPPMDFADGFTLWRGLGVDYEGGVLANDSAVAIHVSHRLGALVTLLYLGWLGLRILRVGASDTLRTLGVVLLIVLFAQVSLGIANVVMTLPLPVAVAHNGVGAVLLLCVVALNHAIRPLEKEVG